MVFCFKNWILLVLQAVGSLYIEDILTAFYFAFTRFNFKGAKILHDLTRGAKNLHDFTRFEFWDNFEKNPSSI